MERQRLWERCVMSPVVEALYAHHPETVYHAERVAAYSSLMAQFAGASRWEVPAINQAALHHDIGKLMLLPELLDAPTITEEQYQEIQRHTAYGVEVGSIHQLPLLDLRVIAEHHEAYDGSGYPQGLIRAEINPIAALVRYTDSFDAAMSRSHHGGKRGVGDIALDIYQKVGTKYDPQWQKEFILLVEWYRDTHCEPG